jgi:DUF971 family protein
MSEARVTLLDVAVSRRAATCTLAWADGALQTVTLAELRRLCPCALCDDQRAQRAANPLTVLSGPAPSAELVGVEPVGGYALRFVWTDGHTSGIYSFEHLREIGGG